MTPRSSAYSATLAGNIAAARVRLRLKQENVAARMTALGWRWYRQTASEVEAGKRRVGAEELLGLAIALETTVGVLTLPPPGTDVIALPSGANLQAQRVSVVDESVTWHGDVPKFSEAAAVGRFEQRLAERRHELAALEEYGRDLGALPREPESGDQQ